MVSRFKNVSNGSIAKYHSSEYKGHKLIVLNPEDRFSFQFGVEKARMILENIDKIRQFVADQNGGGS